MKEIESDVLTILLAGGRARRLGGLDKPALMIGERTLLDGVLDRVAEVVTDPSLIMVVGPTRPTVVPVRWSTERPPGGGPLAGLAAGVDAFGAEFDRHSYLALLAADLVGLRRETLPRLVSQLAGRPDSDGAVLCDARGRRQWLCGVWRTAPLRAVLPSRPTDGSLRSVLSGLTITEVAEQPGESADVDTVEDLAEARVRHNGRLHRRHTADRVG